MLPFHIKVRKKIPTFIRQTFFLSVADSLFVVLIDLFPNVGCCNTEWNYYDFYGGTRIILCNFCIYLSDLIPAPAHLDPESAFKTYTDSKSKNKLILSRKGLKCWATKRFQTIPAYLRNVEPILSGTWCYNLFKLLLLFSSLLLLDYYVFGLDTKNVCDLKVFFCLFFFYIQMRS